MASIRNSAHDEEFFRVFERYLDQVILKMKNEPREAAPEDDYGAEE